MAREIIEFDVVIVGGGPAGLSAAIRLKQGAAATGREISVCLIEKGAEIGAHILSGAVIDPTALNRLIPDWREKGAPLHDPVTEDQTYYLSERCAFVIPPFLMPPLMSNRGMEIVSLSNLCRWLAVEAEGLGVEIFAGFAAAELLLEDGVVRGVASGAFGVARDGHQKRSYAPGTELRGKYTLFAEGARGSLSKQLLKTFALDAGCEVQKFGLGFKELWEIEPANHRRGMVLHTLGWPLDNATGGGSFLYQWGTRYCAIGFVLHLDYQNPFLSPFEEFQQLKRHPLIRPFLEGGRRIGFGARVVSEGGLQSVTKLTFPGGALIGCAAGFMNVPRIKGIHNAMESGMIAAEAVMAALGEGRQGDRLEAYEAGYRASAIYKDLHKVRNVKPLWSRFGTFPGVALGGFDMWTNALFGLNLFGTLGHGKPDGDILNHAAASRPILYPKPDGELTFDRPSSVYLSSTNHDEDQPIHLRLTDPSLPLRVNLPEYGEPAQRYCPAGVYEIIGQGENVRLQINATNCVHCKACDIKDPSQNITWVTPEGGGGPHYANM